MISLSPLRDKNQSHNTQSSIPHLESLTWNHIANAISHELYHSLSTKLIDLIKKHNVTDKDIYNKERVQEVLQKLRIKASISMREIQYIQQLITRALSNISPKSPLTIQSAVTQRNKTEHHPSKPTFTLEPNIEKEERQITYQRYILGMFDVVWLV